MHKLLTEVTESIWKEIGKDLLVKTISVLVAETARAKLYVWKEIELKKAKRDLDVQYREADMAWRIERIKAKREAMGINTEEQTLDEPQEPEHTPTSQEHDRPAQDV